MKSMNILVALVVVLASFCSDAFARVYAPELGRWTRRDPAGYVSKSANFYDYGAGDPMILSDPMGLRPIRFAFKSFIPGHLGAGLAGVSGSWFAAPPPVPIVTWYQYWAATDNREFGESGTSRLQSVGSMESLAIGVGSPTASTFSDASGLAIAWNSNPYNPFSVEYKVPTAHWGNTTSVAPCMSKITIRANASDPFYSLAPDLDYNVTFTFVAVGKNRVWIGLDGSHDQFPNYEAFIDGRSFYTYPTPWGALSGITLGLLVGTSVHEPTTVDAPTPFNCWTKDEQNDLFTGGASSYQPCWCLQCIGCTCPCRDGASN